MSHLLSKSEQEFDEVLGESIEEEESAYTSRIQLVLAEKRTSLSVLRTGMVLLTLPLSIVAFLITTSRYYDPMHNLVFMIPLFLINTFLVVMGITLIIRAWKRIRSQDKVIELIKQHATEFIVEHHMENQKE